MFDIDFNIIKDLILLFLVIAVIYLLVNNKHSENFDPSTDIKEAVSAQYGIDLDAMRNLGDIANNILSIDPDTQNTDTLNLPANLTTIKNLKVSGSVNFTEKDSNIMEIFPRYMILAWATDDSLPLGWKLCDGKKYYKTIEGTFTEITLGTTAPAGAEIISTPDLRGRFVLGAGQGVVYDTAGNPTSTQLTNRTFGLKDGEETHLLTANEMPSHSHFMFVKTADKLGDAIFNASVDANGSRYINAGDDAGDSNSYFLKYNSSQSTQPSAGLTSSTGSRAPHNNMPPFNVLYYIMKL
jgi:microcystin-dependent protein